MKPMKHETKFVSTTIIIFIRNEQRVEYFQTQGRKKKRWHLAHLHPLRMDPSIKVKTSLGGIPHRIIARIL